MTSVSKNVHIDKVDDKVNKNNHTYSTIKMKLVDVKSNKYTELDKKNNKEHPKFNVGDYVRIL